MLQRIQTVYILVAIAALITLTLGVDVYSYKLSKTDSAEFVFHVNSYGIQIDGAISEQISDEDQKALTQLLKIQNKTERVSGLSYTSFPFYSISLFLAMITIAALLTFKKLPTQLRLGRMAFFFNLIILIFTVVFYYTLRNQFNDMLDGAEMNSYLGIGFFCIIISTAFLFLANIGIKRDLDLIKSIDRIR
jgi:Flp pilus assembly protein TadB